MTNNSELTRLLEQESYIQALAWVDNHLEFGPDQFFYRAFVCAQLDSSGEPNPQDSIDWLTLADLQLDNFIDAVDDPILKAIGNAFRADLALTENNYLSALTHITWALEECPHDEEMIAKAIQIMDETVDGMRRIDHLIEDNFEDQPDGFEGLWLSDGIAGIEIYDQDELPQSYYDETLELIHRNHFMRDDLISVVADLIKEVFGSLHWN